MPSQTRCARCGKVGLVRLETVIRAGRSERHFYCGACHHSWTVTDARGAERVPEKREVSSRSRSSAQARQVSSASGYLETALPPVVPHRPIGSSAILHVQCPVCRSSKAVVAHTHFRDAMCFCPACEHVWDCDADVLKGAGPPVGV